MRSGAAWLRAPSRQRTGSVPAAHPAHADGERTGGAEPPASGGAEAHGDGTTCPAGRPPRPPLPLLLLDPRRVPDFPGARPAWKRWPSRRARAGGGRRGHRRPARARRRGGRRGRGRRAALGGRASRSPRRRRRPRSRRSPSRRTGIGLDQRQHLGRRRRPGSRSGPESKAAATTWLPQHDDGTAPIIRSGCGPAPRGVTAASRAIVGPRRTGSRTGIVGLYAYEERPGSHGRTGRVTPPVRPRTITRTPEPSPTWLRTRSAPTSTAVSSRRTGDPVHEAVQRLLRDPGRCSEEAMRLEGCGSSHPQAQHQQPGRVRLRCPPAILGFMLRNLAEAHTQLRRRELLSARRAVMSRTTRQGHPALRRGHLPGQRRVLSWSDVDAGAARRRRRVLVGPTTIPLWTASVLAGRRYGRALRCDERADWMPDLADIERKITDRTRRSAITSTRTTRPAPSTTTDAPLSLTEIARRHNLVVCSDEIYDKISATAAPARRPPPSPPACWS